MINHIAWSKKDILPDYLKKYFTESDDFCRLTTNQNEVNMRIFVIGSGNWGTTLATLFCKKNDVYLWTIDQKEADEINLNRENKAFLPGKKIDKRITIECKYSRPIEKEDLVILAIPSRRVEAVAIELQKTGVYNIMNVSKGLKHDSLMTIQQIVLEHLPTVRFATLSGPTISREIANGLPAKAVLASNDMGLLMTLQEALDNDLLIFEFSRDIDGIELCGSLKGLIAIAVGIADGLGLKTNIYGLIMTYGLQEFATVLEFLGVSTKTVYGIAGAGDLITTCLSENSRNRRFGKLLGEGKSREEALQEVGMVVEGVSMAKTIQQISRFNLNIPLFDSIARIIFEPVEDVRKALLNPLLYR